MKYRDLREFILGLERLGELKRVAKPVSTRLEMTALSDRVLKAMNRSHTAESYLRVLERVRAARPVIMASRLRGTSTAMATCTTTKRTSSAIATKCT